MLPDFGAGLIDFVQDPLAACEKQHALRRQGHAPRAAMEKPGAELLFQANDALSDRRCRDTQDATCINEASRLSDLNEDVDCADPVHKALHCGSYSPV